MIPALLLLAGASSTLGRLALRGVRLDRERTLEWASVVFAAGLGLVGILLGLLALVGRFHWSPWVLGALTIPALLRGRVWARGLDVASLRTGTIAVAIVVGSAALGSIAPVTDDDSLAYVLPIAERVAREGQWRFWPEQSRSVFPLSQEMLLAFAIRLGGTRLGLIAAMELILCVCLLAALSRRLAAATTSSGLAILLTLGAPVTVFLTWSAKDDLLLLAMTLATAVCLTHTERVDTATGLFAGLAAGAKYAGLPIPAAAVGWVLITAPDRKIRRAQRVLLASLLAGGLWYGMNLWRFGNPVPPALPWLGHSPFAPDAIAPPPGGIETGRSAADLLLAPVRIFLEPSVFRGRGGWFNPAVYVGLAGLASASMRRRYAPLYWLALVVYASWFVEWQMMSARHLLPAVALLAVPAADVLVSSSQRRVIRSLTAWLALASAGVVLLFAGIRTARYISDPDGFLERESQNYADIQWMNDHLDRDRHRVATTIKALGYLRVPWLPLDPTYQVEISPEDLADGRRLIVALRRQGVTHLYTNAELARTMGLYEVLTQVRANPASRLGGVRFLREPPTEHTVLFSLTGPG